MREISDSASSLALIKAMPGNIGLEPMLCEIEKPTIRSTGAVGTSADNAAAEAFDGTLKRETPQGARRWPSARQAMSPPRWNSRGEPTAPRA